MTQEKMEELAKAAAHSAVVTRYSTRCCDDLREAVEEYLIAYEYAIKQIVLSQQGLKNEPNESDFRR